MKLDEMFAMERPLLQVGKRKVNVCCSYLGYHGIDKEAKPEKKSWLRQEKTGGDD